MRAIISIINLGLDLVRESKYPKSIFLNFIHCDYFAFRSLEDGFLTIPTILLYNNRSSTGFAM
jgi:hypothetical protein